MTKPILQMTVMLISLLSGCDSVVMSTPGMAHEEDRDVGCTYPGYCMNCGLKFSGKFTCGVGFFYACPGHQPGRVRITAMTDVFKSGEVRRYEDIQVIARGGVCH